MAMDRAKFARLVDMLAGRIPVSHNPENKKEFRSLSLTFMREVAKAAGLASNECAFRFNAGGPAVSGDAILHHERVYVMLNADGICKWVLVRTCKGRQDYVGGLNQSIQFDELAAMGVDGVARFVKQVAA